MAKRPKTARQATKKRKASAPRKRSADAGARKETTRLKRELAEALERQKATGEILAAISHSTSELQPILDTIVRTASRLCDAELLMAARISPVAFCRSSASASSRFSRVVSFLAPTSADRFRGVEALRFLVALRAGFWRLAIPCVSVPKGFNQCVSLSKRRTGV